MQCNIREFLQFFQQWRHYAVTCQLSAQEIVNWVTTSDGCVHTADTTQLDSFVASASAVCIGHKGVYSSSPKTYLRATGRHLPYGITQCYLPPDTSLTPARKVGTRLTYPKVMESWVDLDGWLHTHMVYLPQTVTDPSINRARRRVWSRTTRCR